jgi:hypothetical protein
MRPPRIPPAAFISSMAISAPLKVLLPVSLSKDPINPTTTGGLDAEKAGLIKAASKKTEAVINIPIRNE